MVAAFGVYAYLLCGCLVVGVVGVVAAVIEQKYRQSSK
jgi:hypothetical protein